MMIGGVESSPGTLVVLWEKENPENVPSTAVNEQLFPQMVSDGAAGAIVVWADLRNGLNTDVYAQRVNGSGAVLWAADGVPIAAAANNQSVPNWFPTARAARSSPGKTTGPGRLTFTRSG